MNKNVSLAGMLAWQDIRQAYRRSALGPFWLTIGMGLQIITMGLVFSLIFESEIQEYLPFLAVSIIFWGLISTTINEGCLTFTSSESMIKQLNLSQAVYVLRTILKNLFTTAHNLVIVPIVLVVFLKPPSLALLLLIPGLLLLTVNLGWVVVILAVAAARFRDIVPIVNSLVTIGFFVTPVMWSPNLIAGNQASQLLLGLNPLFHWIQIVRLPILGEFPTAENWTAASIVAVVGWVSAFFIQKRFRHMIPYWV